MTPICSKCKRVIPDEDINVATDVAFCRICHIATKLSDLVSGTQLDNLDLGHPPPGVWRRGSGLGVVIGATHRSIGAAIGTLAISLFWNGILSVFICLAISATLHNFHMNAPDWFPNPKMNGKIMSVGMTIFLWLFLTPFIVIGAAMIGAFFSAVAGRTEIEIRQNLSQIFVGIGPLGWRREFKRESVKNVRIDEGAWRDSNGNRRNKRQIVIETEDGKDIKFGSMLREDRMNFLAAALRQALLQ